MTGSCKREVSQTWQKESNDGERNFPCELGREIKGMEIKQRKKVHSFVAK